MYREIDIMHWERRGDFEFFDTFATSLFSISVHLDCAAIAGIRSKSRALLYAAMAGVNKVENFRYRQLGERVVLYDKLDLLSTIRSKNGKRFSTIHVAWDEDPVRFKNSIDVAVDALEGQADPFEAEKRLIARGDHGQAIVNVIPDIDLVSYSSAIPDKGDVYYPIVTIGAIDPQTDKVVASLFCDHKFIDGPAVAAFSNAFVEALNAWRKLV